MKRAMYVIGMFCALLLVLSACSTPIEIAGSSERQGIYFPTLGNNQLSGDSATHADGNTTPLNVGFGTEMSLWVNCSGDVDVDALSYWVSADRTLWTAGDVVLAGCLDNLTKHDLTDNGVQWIQFDFDINSSNATGAIRTVLSVK